MLNKKEGKVLIKKMMPVKPVVPKFQGKGTKARLNTAAEKHMFNSKYSK